MQGSKKPRASTKEPYDYLAKIVIIGNSAVGKTNILLRFINQNYSLSHTPTIGVDFRSKVLQISVPKEREKKKLKLQLWDTAGQERFRNLTDTYFKGASGIIVVYAINDRKSFTQVKDWIYQLQQNGAEKLPKLIVGNKCDLQDDRKVSFQQGRILADSFKSLFMEVSAKENINIEETFTQLGMTLIANLQEEMSPSKLKTETQKPSTLLINPPVHSKQCCN